MKKTGKINLPLTHEKIVKSLLKLSSGLIHPSVMFYKDALLKIVDIKMNSNMLRIMICICV